MEVNRTSQFGLPGGVVAGEIAAQGSHAAALGGAGALRPGETFEDLLNRAKSVGAKRKSKQEQVEQVAGDLVAHALILPVLKQVRRSSWNENPAFGGGNGEKMFGPEFDMAMAERIAHSPNMGVRKALVNRLMQRDARRVNVNG